MQTLVRTNATMIGSCTFLIGSFLFIPDISSCHDSRLTAVAIYLFIGGSVVFVFVSALAFRREVPEVLDEATVKQQRQQRARVEEASAGSAAADGTVGLGHSGQGGGTGSVEMAPTTAIEAAPGTVEACDAV